MANIVISVWHDREGSGDPEVEVKIPASMAKWVPKLMRLIPKKAKEETWGTQEIDFESAFVDLDKMVKEATATGQAELMTAKTRDGLVKITIER